MPGIVFVTCAYMPLQTGSKSISDQIPGTNQVGTITEVPLANGNVTVNVPTGCVACLIAPPTPSPATLSWGLDSAHLNAISVSNPTLISFNTASLPASFVLASGATGFTVEVTFW